MADNWTTDFSLRGHWKLDGDASDSSWYASKVKIGVFGGTGNYFEGLIDEVRIYDRALIQTEIGELFNIGN